MPGEREKGGGGDERSPPFRVGLHLGCNHLRVIEGAYFMGLLRSSRVRTGPSPAQSKVSKPVRKRKVGLDKLHANRSMAVQEVWAMSGIKRGSSESGTQP